VRRFDNFITGASHTITPVLVGHQIQDIGLLLSLRSGKTRLGNKINTYRGQSRTFEKIPACYFR
jgi:hypothetical protein